MNRTNACAYLSIERCQHSKSTIQLVKCYECDSLLHHLCQTDYASLKGLVERDNVGEHKVCPNLSCLKTCYIINDDDDDDDDESPSSPPSTSTTTNNDTENPSKPTNFALPKYPPEHFLQHASSQKKSRFWRYFWEVNPSRCIDTETEFIGKARCKLCTENEHYVSSKSGTNSLSFHLKKAHPELYAFLHEDTIKKAPTRSEDTMKKAPTRSDIRSVKGLTKKKSVQDRKSAFQDAVVRWVMEDSIPFRAVESKAFRSMVNAVVENEREFEIFKMTGDGVRKQILHRGLLAKKATKLELQNYQCAFTTDHWTGPSDETYTTLTGHYINQGWEYHSCVVDFKVFHGKTRGQECGEDLYNIFDDYEFKDENVTIVMTDTTASMITFGKAIRNEREIEHGFCVDHNLHRNCILAFDDENLPRSDGAMKTARATIEYFSKSTQAMENLKSFQNISMLEKYREEKEPKKILQDSRTQWSSTYRMLHRLHFLREAIGGLRASNEIECTSPTDLQWNILEDVQQTLKAPAELQRVLEGESHITGSLTPFAIHKIRSGYKEAIEDDRTNESVKYLANILLKDLDERYYPTECGKVQYFSKPDTGFRNRYISLHPYMFFAAFLDPRMKVNLASIMSYNNYKDLLSDILDNMVSMNVQIPNNSHDGNNDYNERINERASNRGPRTKRRKQSPSVFDNFVNGGSNHNQNDRDTPRHQTSEIRRTCQMELDLFEDRNVTIPLRNPSGKFNDPLSWWKSQGALRFPHLAKLAKRYLCIPATSASSERVWSRASNILTIRRARMSDTVAGCIMFTKENARILRKHYTALTGSNYAPHLPSVYEASIEDYIFEDEE